MIAPTATNSRGSYGSFDEIDGVIAIALVVMSSV
jgi:hypothetical protein